jgi:hypothetical protein
MPTSPSHHPLGDVDDDADSYDYARANAEHALAVGDWTLLLSRLISAIAVLVVVLIACGVFPAAAIALVPSLLGLAIVAPYPPKGQQTDYRAIPPGSCSFELAQSKVPIKARGVAPVRNASRTLVDAGFVKDTRASDENAPTPADQAPVDCACSRLAT